MRYGAMQRFLAKKGKRKVPDTPARAKNAIKYLDGLSEKEWYEYWSLRDQIKAVA